MKKKLITLTRIFLTTLIVVSLAVVGIGLMPLYRAYASTENFTSVNWNNGSPQLDQGSDLTIISNKITYTTQANTNKAYFYRDYGIDYWDSNFNIRFEWLIDTADNYYVGPFLMFANAVGDTKVLADASEDYVGFYFYNNNGTRQLKIIERVGASTYTDTATIYEDNIYYVQLERDESVGENGTLCAYIARNNYWDDGGTKVDVLKVNLHEKEDFRYFYAINCYDSENTPDGTGYIQNLDLQEGDDLTRAFHISVNSTSHTNYGLGYPVTYIFSIPGDIELDGYYKYNSGDSWSQFTEKTADDYFNGIDCVRFDYTNGLAYVSKSFSTTSDDIYIKITDNTSTLIDNAHYIGMATYYDNRTAAVTITMDDWNDSNAANFTSASDAIQSRNMVMTGGIITSSCNSTTWASIQSQYDEGLIELAAHSRTHPHVPYGDYNSEIAGCKQDIVGNITLSEPYIGDGIEYVPAWLEPYGESDATARGLLGDNYYLADRSTANPVYIFATWDATNELYNRIGVSSYMGIDYGEDDEGILNGRFDTAYAAGNIYHLMGHPWDEDWTPGSFTLNHLDYIDGKKDVWYVGFGALYMYHYCQSQSNIIIVISYDDESSPTVTTSAASSVTCNSATGNGNITSIGSANVTYRGFQYGIGEYSDNVSESGNWGTGVFDLAITGLDADTEYQYRAFAQNEVGISYGDSVNFTTSASADPTFTTNNATLITTTTARLNGTISGLTCDMASDTFWEWGLATGNYTANYTDIVNRNNGTVYRDISSLTSNTTYYFRGASRLDGGAWQYGSELSFTTSEESTPTPSSDTNEVIQAIPLLTAAILSLAIIRFAFGQESWSIVGLIEIVILTYLLYIAIVGITSGVAAI